MGKILHGSRLGVIVLFVSVIINLFFVYNQYGGKKEVVQQLSWSRRAAAEAEAVAAISCSGHGHAYLDGVPFQGEPRCECNTCYVGKDCSLFLPDCSADADSGDPLFLEPFWMQHAASSAVVVAGWHRMSYGFSDASTMSEELEKHIRELHTVTGNAVTDGKYMIFGAGSTQLLNAAMLAVSPEDSPVPASIVASIPFYPLYKSQAEFFKYVEYRWKGDTSLWKNQSDSSTTFIELVTSPNNPDGRLNKRVVQGSYSKPIFDHAYYWPHFTAIPSASNEDLMIFTLSKLTGHAGSRFGWALIKDEKLYKRMSMYIRLNTLIISRDTQLRALKLVKAALKEKGRTLFEYGSKTMTNRWKTISQSFSSSKRFSLQKLEPQYCTYFQNVTEPSPAYAWVKCEREEDEDCKEVLKRAGIIGRGGTLFSAESRYVRLSLLKSNDDFNLLVQKIDILVSKESSAAYI